MHYGHIIDFLNKTSWAITPEALENMHEILGLRLRDGRATEAEIEVRVGEGQERPNAPYMKGSTAVIPIMGPLAKKMNIFTRISGGTSYELLQKDIQTAMDDKKVKDVLFDVDSPGGSVDGLFDVAEFMLGCRGRKPMKALANGMMTSAAYLLGSSADEVVATSASRVGSIGVITAHYDYSKADEKAGVKKTYLYSGKYKAMGHDAEPLSDEARAYIQSQLDHYYTMFVDAVAKNRGVDKDTVLSKMADGKIFIGEQAVEGGLIDSVGTFDKLIKLINPKKKEVKLMEPSEYKKEHPEEYLKLTEKVKNETAIEVRTEMQGQIDEKDKRIVELTAENETLTSSLDEGEKRLLVLEKKDTLRDEREMKKDADRIWASELAASDIPPRLHPKVSNQVSHEGFIKEGSFDQDGFKEAVQAEIKTWDGIGGTETVIGGAAPVIGEGAGKDVAAEAAEDDAAVDEMLEMAEGPATQH